MGWNRQSASVNYRDPDYAIRPAHATRNRTFCGWEFALPIEAMDVPEINDAKPLALVSQVFGNRDSPL
jgi:hypothetical protein